MYPARQHKRKKPPLRDKEVGIPSKSAPISTSQRCSICFEIKPQSEFRRRYRDRPDRVRQCRECHNDSERLRRGLKRERLNKKELSKTLTALKNEQSDRKVKVLCCEMAHRFGGMDGIIEAWQQSIDKDLEQGGYAAFRHISAMIRLLQYYEENKPDYSTMSDEELLEKMSRSVLD